MLKKLLVGVGIFFGIILLIILQYVLVNVFASREIRYKEKFITTNPVDLTQIVRISKFRSCEGHDFSGYNPEGKRETNRSMKHYMTPVDELYNNKGVVSVFAPFDGVIYSSANEGRSNQVVIFHPDSDWYFIYFHIALIEGLDVGSEIKSGELIGYANTLDADNFDMALMYGNPPAIFTFITNKILRIGSPPFFLQYDSPFNYMTDEVLSEYEDLGFEGESFVIDEEYRDQNPCTYDVPTSPNKDDWNSFVPWPYWSGNPPLIKQD